MATQTLPNGYCGLLPVQKSCPHANACLTCPFFLTGPEFLPELREQRTRTLTLIDNATVPPHDPRRPGSGAVAFAVRLRARVGDSVLPER
ncbi:hypothetical protein [Streptomyces sp. NPDC059909]|uniref:hypothetical protein n=1 Tax=Streptomyces sp. NPDC059909 TaxID=3346998 RepID=UPI003646AA2C